MPWQDPTDYPANAIPTASGTSNLNINAKVIAKIRQLYDFLHGDESLDFLFRGSPNTDIRFQLADNAGATKFAALGSSNGTVFAVDSTGQLRAGYIDSVTIAAQFPGTMSVATKVNNLRILAPYTFAATELATVCDNTMGIGTGGTATWSIVNSSAGTLGTLRVTPGNTIGTALISAISIPKHSVFTFNALETGGGAAPGQDFNIQIRGYRTGTIYPG